MKKLCDSCRHYAEHYGFCGVKRIRIVWILVDYCKDYEKKGGVAHDRIV